MPPQADELPVSHLTYSSGDLPSSYLLYKTGSLSIIDANISLISCGFSTVFSSDKVAQLNKQLPSAFTNSYSILIASLGLHPIFLAYNSYFSISID